MTRRLTSFAAVLFFAAAASAADLSTLTGKKYRGEFRKIENGLLTFDADIGAVAVPLKDLFVLDFGRKPLAPAEGAGYDELELTDGSIVRCTGIKIKGKAVEVALLPVAGNPPPTIAVPLDSIYSYCRGADVPKNRDDWKKLLANRGKRDLYVMRLETGLNVVEGTVLEGVEDGDKISNLSFEQVNGEKKLLRLDRATGGLVFNQPPRTVIPPTVCTLFDVFGNTLFVAKLEVTGGGMTATTVNGATVASATAALTKLDFSRGNIAYLSDLDCTVTAPKPEFDDTTTPFRKDFDSEKQQLKLADTSYAKGLLIPAETVVTYKLKDDFRELKAIVGIPDATTHPSSTAKLTIKADGRDLFSGPITRKAKPKELVLDVKGVKELTIRVDPDGMYTGNQVVLAEARLQK